MPSLSRAITEANKHKRDELLWDERCKAIMQMGEDYPEGFSATMCIERYPELFIDHHRFRIFVKKMIYRDSNLKFDVPRGSGRRFFYKESPFKRMLINWDKHHARNCTNFMHSGTNHLRQE